MLVGANSVVIPWLGHGIHEFPSTNTRPARPNSWMPRPSLGMTGGVWRCPAHAERENCQMTCKPGSVRGLAAPGWPFLWDDRCRPPHATYPRIWRGSRLVWIAPNPSSYAVLLPAGFTVPRPLPAARCALTAPFHPYRRTGRTRVAGGLFSVALSLGSRPPAVNRRRSSMEPGLSSLLFRAERPSSHLARLS